MHERRMDAKTESFEIVLRDFFYNNTTKRLEFIAQLLGFTLDRTTPKYNSHLINS
jgi:hypothetical protein